VITSVIDPSSDARHLATSLHQLCRSGSPPGGSQNRHLRAAAGWPQRGQPHPRVRAHMSLCGTAHIRAQEHATEDRGRSLEGE